MSKHTVTASTGTSADVVADLRAARTSRWADRPTSLANPRRTRLAQLMDGVA